MAAFLPLPDRTVLSIAGDDRLDFLQGLVSNDMRRVAPERAAFTAFLTPQGKFLHDFFVADGDARFLVDCDGERAADLIRRLKLYKLRSKVAIAADGGGLAVFVGFGEGAAEALGLDPADPGAARPIDGGAVFVDPRLGRLGVRALLPAADGAARLREAGLAPGSAEALDRLRLAAGVPDGRRDAELERSTLLEMNYDDLNAIAWDKGCYMGQELTARTRYRGLVKRRLMPVAVDGPLPEPGTPITANGREVGQIRSGLGDRALALMRLDALAGEEAEARGFAAGEATVRPERPDWARY